jgi:hypothetical protein
MEPLMRSKGHGMWRVAGSFMAACMFGASSHATGPDRLKQLIDEPAGWASYDWAKPTDVAVHNESGWVYVIEIPTPGVQPTLERTLQAYGGAWRVRWTPDGLPSLWVFRDMPSADCPAVIESFGKTLGPAEFSVKRSREMRDGRSVESILKLWRWRIGRTQIDASCGADSNDQPGRVSWNAISLDIDSIDRAKLREQAAAGASVSRER